MKHKVNPGNSKFINILYSISFLIVIAICSLLVNILLDIVLDNESFLYSLFSLLFALLLSLSILFIPLSIIAIIISPSSYFYSVRSTYQKNIKEALKTEYPHGVVYILEGVLRELDKLGLDLDPYSRYFPGDKDDKAGTYGFPNKTNLKETIKMARELSKDWEQLDALEPAKASQYMAQIRARIQQEDFYLSTKINPKKGQDIYYYSYGEEDYKGEIQPENTFYKKYRASNEEGEQNHSREHKDIPHYQNSSQNRENNLHKKSQLDREQNTQQSKDTNVNDSIQERSDYQNNTEHNILDFDTWQEKTVDIYGFLSEQQKQEEYQRYRSSFPIDKEQLDSQNNSEHNILNFDNWIEKTSDIYRHLSQQQKREEYQRYRNSFLIDDDKPYYS